MAGAAIAPMKNVFKIQIMNISERYLTMAPIITTRKEEAQKEVRKKKGDIRGWFSPRLQCGHPKKNGPRSHPKKNGPSMEKKAPPPPVQRSNASIRGRGC